MANPHPTPKPENLRRPWPPGTSGNPAGYSRGRRISDAIERLIEEMALDREFGATAIAMALGKKYMLKRKVKDPETGSGRGHPLSGTWETWMAPNVNGKGNSLIHRFDRCTLVVDRGHECGVRIHSSSTKPEEDE